VRDSLAFLRQPAMWGLDTYHVLVDIWCPLAKMMHLFSAHTKLGLSRFRIAANDKCITCMECSRNCQVGIDVMIYALKQQPLDNGTSSCIGCGICVSVCPMDVLSFGTAAKPKLVQPAQRPPGLCAFLGSCSSGQVSCLYVHSRA
jgi:polyferredoxin